MPELSYAQQLTAAARAVARIELRRRRIRQQLANTETDYREAQRQLRLLVQSTEPYTPPSLADAVRAADTAAELS